MLHSLAGIKVRYLEFMTLFNCVIFITTNVRVLEVITPLYQIMTNLLRAHHITSIC